MAKSSGLGDAFYVGGYKLSGDVNNVTLSGGPKPLDVTGIDKSGMERIGGVRDGKVTFVAFFNPATVPTFQEHAVLSTLPRTDVATQYGRGTSLGSAAACCVGKQLNYDPTRGPDGSLTFKSEVDANGFGLEWGVQLTAGQRTDVAATNGTGVDLTAVSTAFGWQAYLQVFSFVGTDATVKIQDSADNTTFADLASGAFVQTTTAPGSQRIAVGGTATVRRYLRVATVTTGGFTSLVFAVVFVRNATAVSF